MIRKIHFVWIGSDLPDWAARNIRQFRRLNPRHEIIIHGEEVLLDELRGNYDQCGHLCSRADLLRLSALKRHGGWYFDVDFWPFRSLDDAARAWELDGSLLFVSRQQGHRSGDRMPFANAPMAAGPECAGLDLLIEMATSLPPRSRLGYGPRLIKEAMEHYAHLFEVADAPWFFPFAISEAPAAYRQLVDDPTRLRVRGPATSGQMPFAAHLWAQANEQQITTGAQQTDRPIALVPEASRDDNPLHAAAEGLERIGYEVMRSRHPEVIGRTPAVAVVWNGLRKPLWYTRAAEWGAQMLIMEHGFFDRQRFSQVDTEGFLHRAGWRHLLGEPAPLGSAARLAQHYPDGLVEMRSRRSGYVLVLGQVPGDTQMRDSEIREPKAFCRLIASALPSGVQAVVRPHPMLANAKSAANLGGLPILKPDREEAGIYRDTKQGGGLAEALAGARFVIAVNSNGLNEALAAGIPCAALGPMLGIESGAVRQMTIATIADDLRAMVDGWAPEPETVTNYLRWLAARQWSLEELAAGDVLAGLLGSADAIREAV